MKVFEKSFRINPRITYFPVLLVEIFKVETGETETKNFEKRSRGLSQRTRVWIGFFHPKFPSLYAVYSATLFELYFVMYCYMNVHNIPYGNFHYWEYRKILIVDFLCNYKEDLFSGHFVYKLENEEIYTEQIFFLPFHRLWNVLRPKKWWKRRLKNVNQLDIRKFTNACQVYQQS